MAARRYYFPKFDKKHPMCYVARTSRQMVASNEQIVDVFKKYAKESYPGSPRQILYLMTRHNESVFEAIESGSASPKVKSSPESSSPRKRKAKVSTLKRKKLPFDALAKSEHKESKSSIKITKKDNVQELTSPNADIKMSEIPDTTEIQTIEFKRPATPIKDTTEESSFAKRQKMTDIADIDVPSKQTENLENEDSTKTMEKDDVQESTSPSASIIVLDNPDTAEIIENIEFIRPATPIKDGAEQSSLAERLKLTDTADVDIPSKQTENLETEGSIKTMEDVQESTSSKMSENPDMAEVIQTIEFKRPATPIKDGTEESNLAKRPKLSDTADIDAPSKQTENSKTEDSIETMEKKDVKESTSPRASIKTSENLNTSEAIKTAEIKRPASPIKDGTEESSHAKRPKLTDTADIDIPSKQTENLETEGSIKTMEKDVQGLTNPSASIKMSENPDTMEVIENIEFKRSASPIKDITEESCLVKRPASPIKDGTEESSHAKRPKLTDTADIDIPSKQIENLETEGSIKTMGEDNVQASTIPSASIKMSEKPDTAEILQNIEFKRPATPIRDVTEKSSSSKRPKLTDTANIDVPSKQTETLIPSAERDKMDVSPIISDEKDLSPDQGKLPENIRLLIKSIPIMEKDEIEINMSAKSNENFEGAETEIYHLVDDPSRVESVRKAVEVRLKDDAFLKKSKDRSPSKGKASNPSPRKSRRIHSPGKDTEKILGSDDPDIISTHPSVLEYLKVRFSLVKKYRHKYMHQILESLKAFQGDLLFLYYYVKTTSLLVESTPVEDKDYFTENLKNLIDGFVENAKKIADKLRVSLTALKSDILFWSSGLKQIRKLAAKNEPLISKKSDPEKSVPLLRKYESDLRKIWEQMDSRILLRNGLRSALLEMTADYAKVTEDFVKYLVMIEILKPSLASTAEGVQEK